MQTQTQSEPLSGHADPLSICDVSVLRAALVRANGELVNCQMQIKARERLIDSLASQIAVIVNAKLARGERGVLDAVEAMIQRHVILSPAAEEVH